MTISEFRSNLTARNNKLSTTEVEELSLNIANKSLELPIWNASYYHIFLSTPERKAVNTDYLLHILQGKDKSITVPKVNVENRKLSHILLQENTSLFITAQGMPEPISGIEVPLNQIEVVFIPLLAFDAKGNRIGYEKDLYDQFLAKCCQHTIIVGLSLFEAQENAFLDNAHINLHFCVTPQKVYSFLV